MKNKWYAGNARQLLQERQYGNVPYGPVVVEMTGGAWDATTLHLNADTPVANMDWRMLVNLDVWIWANASVGLGRLLDVALLIARARPKTLIVRFEDGDKVHDVQVGDGFHLPKVAEIPGKHEFQLCISNNSGTKIGAALRRALLEKTYGLSVL